VCVCVCVCVNVPHSLDRVLAHRFKRLHDLGIVSEAEWNELQIEKNELSTRVVGLNQSEAVVSLLFGTKKPPPSSHLPSDWSECD
jgi:hypothetical protein